MPHTTLDRLLCFLLLTLILVGLFFGKDQGEVLAPLFVLGF